MDNYLKSAKSQAHTQDSRPDAGVAAYWRSRGVDTEPDTRLSDEQHRQTFQSKKSTGDFRNREKITREIGAMYDSILRAAGFEPIERRTAWAIECQIYQRKDRDKPIGISLASIGAALTSRSDDPEAVKRAAIRHVGHLFNHAIPRTGFQILTRYKAEEDSGRPHEYLSHVFPVATFFAEVLAEEIAAILSDKSLDRQARRARIEAAREALIAEALGDGYLPRCDAEILDESGALYAYVSAPEAKAYCDAKPQYTARPITYTPPPAPGCAPQKRPLTGQDFARLKDRAVRLAIDSVLDEIVERNSFEAARLFLRAELLPALNKAAESWVKVAGGRVREEREELIHGHDLSPLPSSESAETDPEIEQGGGDNLSPPPADNLSADNELQTPNFEIVENSAPETPSGSINFDTAEEAALFYAADGWHVLPICQWDASNNRCTAPWHPADCGGRRPLKKGSGTPGEGYWATLDKGRIRALWRKYPWAGVGIRLDGHILIDCDLKDGGPESYTYLRDTFDLPPTLTAITQSGGHHYVFKLPDDLPADWLKSWTRIGDKVALPGIDLKVDKCGLLFAEPTRGSKGVYRWIDPTVEPAELPRAVCDFLHNARYKDDAPKAEKRQASRIYSWSDQPREFDADQSRFFRDVAPGDRHKRLFTVAVAIAKQTGANADKIKSALNYHAAHFSTPLNDPAWIDRVAQSLGGAR